MSGPVNPASLVGTSALPGEPVSAREATRLWARVALQSFGGPAGQIAVIHRLVVEERRWLDEERFLHALSYCMLLPGPEAQQLATYVGWLLNGTRGGLIAGGLFILPGFLSILLLSLAYVGFHDAALITGVFYGLKPAVIAVVVEAVWRLRRRALTGVLAVVLAAAAFLAIYAFAVPFPLIVLGAGLIGWTVDGRRVVGHGDLAPEIDASPISWRRTARTAATWLAIWLVPVAGMRMVLGSGHVLVQESFFFSRAAVVTFGGAYAVLAYVAQRAVEAYHWLSPGQMLDGLGLAETTPGPLIQVVQFVGFLGASNRAGAHPMLAGLLGAIVTTWVTFAPCFLFIFVGAPFVERLRQHRALAAALRGITAAVVGVILNLAVWFALHTLFASQRAVTVGWLSILVPDWGTLDVRAALISAGALLLLFRWRWGMLRTLGVAGAAGIVLRLLG